MKALSLTPCLSASSLDVLMVLLRILRAQRFFQSEAPLAATKATTLSMMGRELSDEAPGEGARDPLAGRPKLAVGLAGHGEKVPWSQGPSWAWSRYRASLSRAVVSEGSLAWLTGRGCEEDDSDSDKSWLWLGADLVVLSGERVGEREREVSELLAV